MFLYHQKLSFWAVILWSFDQNSLKYQFCLKFWPMLTCKMVHQICCSFYWSIRKLSELGRKADFSNHFEGFFFAYSLLHPMSYNPTFWQMKDLLKIYICVSVVNFISIAFVFVKLTIFKVFRIDSAAMNGGVGPHSPKYQAWPWVACDGLHTRPHTSYFI